MAFTNREEPCILLASRMGEAPLRLYFILSKNQYS